MTAWGKNFPAFEPEKRPNQMEGGVDRKCSTFRRRITEPHSITLGWVYPAVRAAVGGVSTALGWSFYEVKTPTL
jgi:hypothetical protein